MREQYLEKSNTTLPQLLIENAATYKNRVAMREKYKGIWQEISWQTYLERVKFFSLGLVELGMQTGANASILGENCPEWLFADLAIQSMRGISIGIYPSNSEEQVKYILDHSKSEFAVVKDQEQADKVLAVKADLPLLKKVIVIDMRGMRQYDDPIIISFSEVEALGRKRDATDQNLFENLVAQTRPEDIAIIIYTSGTTGHPKGCMLPQQTFIRNNIALNAMFQFSDKDNLLSYLPLCHILERGLSMCAHLVNGFTINFAESIDTVQVNIKEISPTVFAAVPRILEKLYTGMEIKLDDTTRFKRFVYNLCAPVGEKVAQFRMNKQPVPFQWQFLYALGYLCSFRSLRDKLGLLRCRVLMSGGAPIAPEVLQHYHSLGVHAIEMWAQTEMCGGATGPHHVVKSGSVGQPIQSLELKLAEDGEILIQADNVFAGYYRDEAATKETIRNGWLHTGDVGRLDEDGHLFIVDRKKDIIITSGGKNISPSEIENKMKCCPYIKEAIVIGDGKNYLTALIQIEYENVGNWAQKKKIAYTNYKHLSQNTDVFELIKYEIEKVNTTLAKVETIKKFKILEKELDQDDEELTATQKIKRKVIESRFEDDIRLLYTR